MSGETKGALIHSPIYTLHSIQISTMYPYQIQRYSHSSNSNDVPDYWPKVHPSQQPLWLGRTHTHTHIVVYLKHHCKIAILFLIICLERMWVLPSLTQHGMESYHVWPMVSVGYLQILHPAENDRNIDGI